MITNVPTHKDFEQHGIMFLNLAWESVFDLLMDFSQAKEWNEILEDDQSDSYWEAARKPLSIAHALAQQGAELILKSKIAAQSPFLLVCAPPGEWPSGCDNDDIAFAEFRTLDAQDLVRAYNTVAATRLPDSFVDRFGKFRRQRNALFHTVDDRLKFSVKEIVGYILEIAQLAAPGKWPALRQAHLEDQPVSQVGAEIVAYRMLREMEHMIDLMGRAHLIGWFGFNKNQRRYVCPRCLWDSDRGHETRHPRTAQLKPNTAKSKNLFCFVCSNDIPVIRKDCIKAACKGNVINTQDDQECLTCFEAQG